MPDAHIASAAATTTTTIPFTQKQDQQQQQTLAFSASGPITAAPFQLNNDPVSLDTAAAAVAAAAASVWDAGEPMSIAHADAMSGSSPIMGQGISTRQRWVNLSQAMTLRGHNLGRIVRRCLDLFFEYLYPLTPLLYEPAVREVVAHIFSSSTSSSSSLGGGVLGETSASPYHMQLSPGATSVGTSPSALSEPRITTPRNDSNSNNIGNGGGGGGGGHSSSSKSSSSSSSRLVPWADSTFILVTAVCAEASFMLPKDIFPEGESVADVFLQASRDGLHQHLEADLESPNANSIAIRYFHSNCLHAVGKPKYSWHIFGEAIRLAHVMQLHDESSMKNLYPIEAELRRRCFWILYLGDKSAAILNNRPITIHKYCFDSGISTLYPSGIENEFASGPFFPSSSSSTNNNNNASSSASSPPPHASRGSFIAGFNAIVRLWQSAADLLLEIRVLQDQTHRITMAMPSPSPMLTSAERQGLDSLYVRFITCLDDLPPYLQSFSTVASPTITPSQAKQFVIQTTNLQVTLHCLRMVIEQKFEDLSYYAPGVEHADLRKSEIVRDMLRVMHDAPFWALQANGEPNVEKIRLIGASLLAIIHRNQDSPLATRARGDFSVLLDILTRLDSKASDALRSDSHTLP